MNRTDSPITSACSDAITLSTACAAVILPTSAIVVLLRQSLGRDRRFKAPDGRPSFKRPPKALLHHFYRLDRPAASRAVTRRRARDHRAVLEGASTTGSRLEPD